MAVMSAVCTNLLHVCVGDNAGVVTVQPLDRLKLVDILPLGILIHPVNFHLLRILVEVLAQTTNVETT